MSAPTSLRAPACGPFWSNGPHASAKPRRTNLLDLFEQRVGAGGLGFADRFLDVELLYDAVVDEHGIALRTNPKAAIGEIERQIEGLGETAAAIGEEFDLALGA